MRIVTYTYIPMLKWLANLTVIMLIFDYIFPTPLNRWLEMSIGLAVSMGIAMLFAYWAMHKEIPQGKALGVMILIWSVVTALLEMLLSYYTFWDPFFTLLRVEFAAQLLAEILGILVMVHVLRRQHAYSRAAEGINLET